MKSYAKHFKNLWIILLAILSAPAHAEFRHFHEWTPTEKNLYLAYNTFAYIDHRQTRVGLRNGYSEINPLYGNNPHRDKSIAINAIISGTMYYFVGKNEPNEMNTLTFGLGMSRFAAVIHNDSIGISWQVAF